MLQLLQVHRLYLVVKAARVRLLEGIVLQRNDELLLLEVDLLKRQGSIAVLLVVGFFVVCSVVQGECEVSLVLRHLHKRRVGECKTCVALALGVVVHHHTVHHICLLVSVVDSEDVALDTVVECTGRDLDLFLCLSDVVTKSVDLVVRYRDEVVGDEECSDTDDNAYESERDEDTLERNTCSLDGEELVVLAERSQRHH